jgi:CheY-like chemotaxis protein
VQLAGLTGEGQAMDFDVFHFIQANKPWFDAAYAASSVLSLVGWTVGLTLLAIAAMRGRISSFTLGPATVALTQMKREAVTETAAAARMWAAPAKAEAVDVPKIRQTIERAFTPEVADALAGKAVLWVDDNPRNNDLVVRALKKLGLHVEQVETTTAGMIRLGERRFDLILSDMGRRDNMRAGYELLEQVRAQDQTVPFFIFAGDDKPEFRAEAKRRGAQLSTNDMVELMSAIVDRLGMPS